MMLLIVGTACEHEAKGTIVTNNKGFDVEYLFTLPDSSCKVYRFHDGGYAHYFASCPGTMMVGYSELEGKTIHYYWRNVETH